MDSTTRPSIESFLTQAREPAVIEPGREPFVLTADNFALSGTPERPLLECWNSSGNLSRRIAGIGVERRGQLELRTEHFGGRKGTLLLVDLAHPGQCDGHPARIAAPLSGTVPAGAAAAVSGLEDR
ncbi:MAG: hypothetical protein WDO18_18495 [Acidobacteriota bacterium]